MVTGTEVEAHELYLYINNDRQLYNQQGLPTIKNLARKKASGTYDHEKAKKAFENYATSGARKYGKEHGTSEREGLEIFSPTVRRMVAEQETKEFEAEYALGNYNRLLPAKYQTRAQKAMMERR